jgi:hypothetical protein
MISFAKRAIVTLLSILVRNRSVFFALMSAVTILKLGYSAFAPASFDLKNIIELANSKPLPIGPWIGLYPPLYNAGYANSTQLLQWALQAPNATPGFTFTSLLLRGPILLLDLITTLALYFVAAKLTSPVEGRLASLMWFLNPYSFLAIELLGVPDIVASLLVICAIILLIERRLLLAGAAVGLGTAFKLFPILLLLPILFWIRSQDYPRKTIASFLCLGLIGLVGYLLWVLPFGLQYVTNYSPVTQPLPFFSGAYWINGSAFWLILFYAFAGLFFRKIGDLLGTVIVTLLVYFAISNPYPQYLVWAMPLMVLEVVLRNRSRILMFAFWNVLAFLQWFIISSAFLAPSGYSLLSFQLRTGTLLGYSSTNDLLFGGTFLGRIVLPSISSGFYAMTLIYALEVARSWIHFGLPKTK